LGEAGQAHLPNLQTGRESNFLYDKWKMANGKWKMEMKSGNDGREI
jgi:hypothetical protein